MTRHEEAAEGGDRGRVGFRLTDQGREYAQDLSNACAYFGPAPVPLTDYLTSVDAHVHVVHDPAVPEGLDEAPRLDAHSAPWASATGARPLGLFLG